jgi:hypothetical protein
MTRALPTRIGRDDAPIHPLRQRRIDELSIMVHCMRSRALVALWSGSWGVAADFEEQAAMLDDAAGLLAHSDEFVEPATPQPTLEEEDESRCPKPGHWNDDQEDESEDGVD